MSAIHEGFHDDADWISTLSQSFFVIRSSCAETRPPDSPALEVQEKQHTVQGKKKKNDS
jgi:hypothetical protein